MYYVVDQSNPKEPMEFIRVTREDIYKIKEKINLERFSDISFRDDKTSLCQYVLQDFEVPYYYDTKPVKVGTIYTFLLNIEALRKSNHYKIVDPLNDIDFILYFDSYSRYYFPPGKSLITNPKFFEDKNYLILNEYITKPPIQSNNLINNNQYPIHSFYNDFNDIESTPAYIFKKFMIHALKNLIDIISSPQYNSLFKNKKANDLFQRGYDEILNITNDFPYFVIKKYFINEIQGCVSSTENKYYDTLLRYLKNLLSKYEISLFIENDFDIINIDKSIQLLFELYVILHLYQSLHIEVSNYDSFFSNSTDYSFDNYENSVTYRANTQSCDSIWFWSNNIYSLLKLLNNISISEGTLRTEYQRIYSKQLKEIYCIYSKNTPLEYLFILRCFTLLADEIKISIQFNFQKKLTDILKMSIDTFQNEIFPEIFSTKEAELYKLRYFFVQSIQKQIFQRKNFLYYNNLNIINCDIEDLFKPAIELYLLFSKHPIVQCSHCHLYFLKTSPNRKFCDSALILKSGKTCKEEREAITDHKSEYQKTTNDFIQYLQKVSLKGGPSYTRRVYNILRKNKYFNPKKPENFDNKDPENFDYLSKTDRKDLLWVLNSFFNYSYAIMESMNFQEIVKDPKFKDIRYYNNSPENTFTPDAYKKLFEEYKTYTRTNKGNGVTEVFNIYDSLVKFSEKDSELSFKTIRSKSMQDLNGNDIEKLFEITETVIRVFFLKLSEWYLEDPKQDYPSFFYAFPKEFATTELSNIEYINKNANDNENENIENLKNKIKKKGNDPYLAQDIKNNIQINEDRKKQVIDLITKLEENGNPQLDRVD